MFIQTEATPNPATLKFIPGRAVLDSGTMEFTDREQAARSPLAEKLFGVPGVTGVFYGSDFVTVTKDDGEWQHLRPPGRSCWSRVLTILVCLGSPVKGAPSTCAISDGSGILLEDS